MKKYQHKTNNSLAELVKKDKSGVVLKLETGEEKTFALSTFYRWWREVEDIQESNPYIPVDKPKGTTNKVPITEEVIEKLQGSNKQLVTAVVKLAQAQQANTFIRTTTGSYNLTKDGVIYLLIRLTKKGATIYAKSKALDGIVEYTPTTGNFDAKISVTDWNSNIYKQVKKVHDLAINYQTTKNKKN